MKYLASIILFTLTSCSLFHPTQEFEMERLSEDILSNKSHSGISITILPIPEPKDKP